MGGHRKVAKKGGSRSATRLAKDPSRSFVKASPTIPNNVGRKTRWKTIHGKLRTVTIVDEISRLQSNAPHKVICLQKIRFDQGGAIEFRLGYYMIGVKPRMAGKWTWGQFAILIPAKDFRWIVRQAAVRGWI